MNRVRWVIPLFGDAYDEDSAASAHREHPIVEAPCRHGNPDPDDHQRVGAGRAFTRLSTRAKAAEPTLITTGTSLMTDPGEMTVSEEDRQFLSHQVFCGCRWPALRVLR